MGRPQWSFVLYVVSCITDFLDGYIARRSKQESAFGAFLDPVADKLMVATALILLVLRMKSALFALAVAVIICREITVTALREWMAEVRWVTLTDKNTIINYD